MTAGTEATAVARPV